MPKAASLLRFYFKSSELNSEGASKANSSGIPVCNQLNYS